MLYKTIATHPDPRYLPRSKLRDNGFIDAGLAKEMEQQSGPCSSRGSTRPADGEEPTLPFLSSPATGCSRPAS